MLVVQFEYANFPISPERIHGSLKYRALLDKLVIKMQTTYGYGFIRLFFVSHLVNIDLIYCHCSKRLPLYCKLLMVLIELIAKPVIHNLILMSGNMCYNTTTQVWWNQWRLRYKNIYISIYVLSVYNLRFAIQLIVEHFGWTINKAISSNYKQSPRILYYVRAPLVSVA